MRRRRKKRKHPQSGSSADNNKAPEMKNAKNQTPKQIFEVNDDEILRKNKHKKSKKTKLTIWDSIILFLLLMENGILDEVLATDEYEEINENLDYQDFDAFKPNSKNNGNKHTNREADNTTNNSANYSDFDYLSED